MEPKFSTTSTFTKEFYTDYAKLCNEKLRSTTKRLVSIAVLFVILAVISVFTRIYIAAVGAVILAIVCPLILLVRINKGISDAWETNDTLKNIETTVNFFEDKLIQKSSNGVIEIEYAKVYKMVESDTVMAIMIASNQGVAIDKKNCSDELLEFVRGKITAK